jgi:hypothetical protein
LGYNLFKLGEAHGQGGLYERIIGQYKICFSLQSSEFFLRYLVICPREKEENLETKKQLHYSQIMEKEMLKTIDGEIHDSYSKEYLFEPKIDKFETKLYKVLKSHSNYYTTAIKFFRRGFRIYTPEKGFNTELHSFNTLKNLNPEVNLLLTLNERKKKKPIIYTLPKAKAK